MKEFMMLIPDDTQVMGISYLREFEDNGTVYNSFDTKAVMVKNIDAFNLETGEVYKWDDKLEDYVLIIENENYVDDEETK